MVTNIFIYQNMPYECDDIFTLIAEFEKNNFTINGLPDKATLLERVKNKKTFFRPTFHGWHLADKQLELEDEEYNRLHSLNSTEIKK